MEQPHLTEDELKLVLLFRQWPPQAQRNLLTLLEEGITARIEAERMVEEEGGSPYG